MVFPLGPGNRPVATEAKPRPNRQIPSRRCIPLGGGGSRSISSHRPNRINVKKPAARYCSLLRSFRASSSVIVAMSERAAFKASALRPSMMREAHKKWRL